MEFSQLAFIVTDDCNFNCSYCPQRKEKIYMNHSTIEKSITFFSPFLKDDACIVFYGGEPLLAFDTIKYAVSLLQKKDVKEKKSLKFSMTTNGSLITDEMLQFFDNHRFNLMLSFDGLIQDMTREPNSFIPTQKLVQRMLSGSYPGIKFSTNSVFTPKTVKYFSASLKYIVESGIADLHFDLAEDMYWDDAALKILDEEQIKLIDFLVAYYKEKGTILLYDFNGEKSRSKNKTSFYCDGGINRMAISPGENVWGCPLFYDYLKNRDDNPDFQRYSFGKLDNFIKKYETIYPRILYNYFSLRQEYFSIESQRCSLCREVNSCGVCPASAAYATSIIGKISPWVCHIGRILKKGKKRFLQEINKIKPIIVSFIYVYMFPYFFNLYSNILLHYKKQQ